MELADELAMLGAELMVGEGEKQELGTVMEIQGVGSMEEGDV